ELGPRSEQEIKRSLEAEIEAERWTPLDRALAREAAANRGIIDLRPDRYPKGDDLQTIKIGRMRQLERLRLADRVGVGQWTPVENAEPTLRAVSATISSSASIVASRSMAGTPDIEFCADKRGPTVLRDRTACRAGTRRRVDGHGLCGDRRDRRPC